jgi:hypothetical protein
MNNSKKPYRVVRSFVERFLTQLLIENKDITEEDKRHIEYDNALKLFPKFNK